MLTANRSNELVGNICGVGFVGRKQRAFLD